MSRPAHRIDVVIAMTKAATDLGWSPRLAESADDEVTVTVQPGPTSSAREVHMAEKNAEVERLRASREALIEHNRELIAERRVLLDKVARAQALIDLWDGEIGAQEDHQSARAIRAVEVCMRDLMAALAVHDDHPGCCTCCGGGGYDNHCAGICWDCRGTGHPHPLPEPEERA